MPRRLDPNDIQRLASAGMLRLDRLLSNLGHCSRGSCRQWLRQNRVCISGKHALAPKAHVDPSTVTVNDKSLVEFSHGIGPLSIILNKPPGFVCSRADEGKEHPLIYSLLPKHFYWRRPLLVPAGRLDKYATGLVVLSQEGPLIHRLTAPKGKRNKMEKVYDIVARRPFRGDEPLLFSSGELSLRGEAGNPCLPAQLEFLDDSLSRARLTLREGRYHQIRRMLAVVNNQAVSIHRRRVGPIELDEAEIPSGHWRPLTSTEYDAIMTYEPEEVDEVVEAETILSAEQVGKDLVELSRKGRPDVNLTEFFPQK